MLLFLLFGTLAFAEQAPNYTDLNSVQARQAMEKLIAKDPAQLPEAERGEWARARFALVALLRMQGKDSEAVAVFSGCGITCEKWGPQNEWAPLKKWGCTKNKTAKPCKKG